MKLKPSCKKTTVAKAVALALFLMLSPAVIAQTLDKTIDTNVAAQPVSTALIALSKQAGVQILMPGKELDKFNTSGLHGRMSLRDALNNLLNGTHFSYHQAGDNTIGIDAPTATSGAPRSGALGAVPAVSTETKIEPAKSTAVQNLGEVVVTGSRLRVGADNSTSPVMIISREDIENQGLATAADIIASIPQNFNSTNAASTTSTPGLDATPRGSLGSASANLFGLGTNATLVLVNGHRLASSPRFQSDGTVDLSTIPAEAIERVEVVMDGASAIYGADAVGGVINFILRKDYSGASIKARADSAANGGNTKNLAGTYGTTWSSGSVMATAEFRHADPINTRLAGWTTSDLTSRGGTDWRDSFYTVPGNVLGYGSLPASYTGLENWAANDLSQSNVVPYDTAAHQDGTPRTNEFSTTLSLSQNLTSGVKANLDVLYSQERNQAAQGALSGFVDVPATNPYNHTGEEVYVATYFPGVPDISSNKVDRLNLTGGLDIDLVKDWKLNVSGSYGTDKSTFISSFMGPDVGNTVNVFGNGTAEGDLTSYVQTLGTTTTSKTYSVNAFANGTLFTLPGGDVKGGAGAEWRPEEYDRGIPYPGTNQTVFKQTNSAAFFEVNAPLVGHTNAMTGIQGLLLDVAGRFDRYEFGGLFNGPSQPEQQNSYSKFSPRVGLVYTPVDAVKVRASWGRSFRAPAIMQFYQPTVVNLAGPQYPTFDPTTGQIVDAHFGSSGNPTLQPETSTTQSYSVEWSPERSGLLLGITYTRFSWNDRITSENATDPQIWPFLVDFPFLIPRNLPASLGGDGNPNTIDAALSAPVNVAKREVEVLNPQITYTLPNTRWGNFNFQWSGVFTMRARDLILPGSPYIQNLATSQGPDRRVFFANIGWNRNNYGLNLYGHYSSSYTNTFNQLYSGSPNTGRTAVASWTTFDLTGFYKTHGMTINAGVKNLANRSFPFYDSAGGPYDPSRVDPRGRTFYVEIRNDFNF